jgi:hypothetical protein
LRPKNPPPVEDGRWRPSGWPGGKQEGVKERWSSSGDGATEAALLLLDLATEDDDDAWRRCWCDDVE